MEYSKTIKPKDNILSFNLEFDEYLNLNNNYDREISKTFIITLENNEKSLMGAQRCVESCKTVGQDNVEIFFGYDGTDKKIIKTPEHLKNADYMKVLKLIDTGLSITEVACLLSHVAVWYECLKLDRPIVILEHDAVMLQPFKTFKFYNTLEYLGHSIEARPISKFFEIDTLSELPKKLLENEIKLDPTLRHPIPFVINQNYIFPMGFHAYAIDPMMARRLYSKVLTEGIINPVDTLAEMGEIEVIQTEIYACDGDDAVVKSTIVDAKDENDSIKKNPFGGRKYSYDIPGVTYE